MTVWDADADDDGVQLGVVAHVVHGTELALLIDIDGARRWVPRAVIHDDSEVFDDGDNATGKLVVQTWWAEQEETA